MIYVPGDFCPRCGKDITGPKPAPDVKVLRTGLLRRAGWTLYKCGCGLTFRRYWPGLAVMVRKVTAMHHNPAQKKGPA